MSNSLTSQASSSSHPAWYIGLTIGIIVAAAALIGYEVRRIFTQMQTRLDRPADDAMSHVVDESLQNDVEQMELIRTDQASKL